MNDERIVSEINKIKGKVLVYVLIVTLLFSGFKLIVYEFIYQLYLVDLFVILVSGFILLMTSMIKENEFYDERLEKKVEHLYKIGYAILLIGGFLIHFISVAITPLDMIAFGYITNTLILIGFVVLLVLLKRKKLYANYKMIEERAALYYKRVIYNITKLLIMFVFILGVVLLIDEIFDILELDLSLFALLIAISFVMLSIEYLIFATYEKNHYDETRLIEKNAPRYLTKNAILFYSVIAIFQIIAAYVSLRYVHVLINFEFVDDLYPWAIYSKLLEYLSVDFAIIRLVMMLIVYAYVKNLTGHKIVMKMVLANAILSFTVSMAEAIKNILLPLITRNMDTMEEVVSFMNNIGYIQFGFSIIFIGFVAFVAFNLYKYRIIYYQLTFVYVGVMIISNPFIMETFFGDYIEPGSYIVFATVFIRIVLLWAIYYLYSNKQFNLEIGLEKHVTYDHKVE
jgi:hypothetical protein